MKIVRVSMENFRSYRGKATIEFNDQLTVFVGPNNAGKSNAILALRLVRKLFARQNEGWKEHVWFNAPSGSLGFEFAVAEEERQGLLEELKLSHLASFKESAFLRGIRANVEFHSQGHVISEAIEIQVGPSKWLALTNGSRTKNGDYQLKTNDLDAGLKAVQGPEELRWIDGQSIGYGSNATEAFVDVFSTGRVQQIYHFIKNFVLRWHWVPPVRTADARVQPGQAATVVEGGKNVIQVLNHYQTEEPDQYPRLMAEVKQLIPQIVKLKAPLRGQQATAIVTESIGHEAEFPAFGSGLHQTFILVVGLLTYPRNSVVLIDEPEIHLHASSQRQLLALMARLAAERQFQIVFTTHSTVLAKRGPGRTIFLVTRPRGHSELTKLDDSEKQRAVIAALGHDNTDLFGYNAVVVVEGETEERAIPVLAAGIDVSFETLGVRLANIRGANKVANLRELLVFLKATGTTPHVWLDDKEDVRVAVSDLVREGLVATGNVLFWQKDFEDCFAIESVVQALNRLLKSHGKEEVSKTGLEEQRASGRLTADWVRRVLFENGLDYNKPIFGEALAEAALAHKDVRSLEPLLAISKLKQYGVG